MTIPAPARCRLPRLNYNIGPNIQLNATAKWMNKSAGYMNCRLEKNDTNYSTPMLPFKPDQGPLGGFSFRAPLAFGSPLERASEAQTFVPSRSRT